LEAVKQAEETTSGNSQRRSVIYFRVARRLALGGAEAESGEVGRTMDGEVGESALKTLWFDTSKSR